MVIENKFEIGETVYLKTDINQYERLVTRLEVTSGNLLYCTALGDSDGIWHYDFELSREKDPMKSILDTSGDH